MKGFKKSAVAVSILALCAVAAGGTLAHATVSVAITSPQEQDHVFNKTWADTANQALVAAGLEPEPTSLIKGTSVDAVSVKLDLAPQGNLRHGDYQGSAQLKPDGTWSFDAGLLLPDTYVVTATATDALGGTAVSSIVASVIA